MQSAIGSDTLSQLFLEARTHSAWLPKDVPDALLHQLIDVMKMAPTSANCSPARIVFVLSADAKAKLAPLLDEGNRAKTLSGIGVDVGMQLLHVLEGFFLAHDLHQRGDDDVGGAG